MIDGQVLTHELGHYFNLRHTFAGVDESGGYYPPTMVGCTDPCREKLEQSGYDRNLFGDFCEDTPPTPCILFDQRECVIDASGNYCNVTYCGGTSSWVHKSCNSSADCNCTYDDAVDYCSDNNPKWGDADPTLINPHNFMSYGTCKVFFTHQQAGRMQCYIDNYLTGLYAEIPSSSPSPSPCSLAVDFRCVQRMGCAGMTNLFFENLSFVDPSAVTPTTYSWDFGDGAPLDNSKNPSHVYTDPGTYDVSLEVCNNGVCATTKFTAYIIVTNTTIPIIAGTDFLEDFTNTQFPPPGWQLVNEQEKEYRDKCIIWQRTEFEPEWCCNAVCWWEPWNPNGCVDLDPNDNTPCCPVADIVGADGVQNNPAAVIRSDCCDPNTIGNTDALITPALDFSTSFNPTLSFNMAYGNFFPVTTPNCWDDAPEDHIDELNVYYSTDCGNTWNILYHRESLNGLETFSRPECTSIPKYNTDWRNETINLNFLKCEKNVKIKFEFVHGFNNNLYLDDVRVFDDLSAVTQIPGGTISGGQNFPPGNYAVMNNLTLLDGNYVMNPGTVFYVFPNVRIAVRQQSSPTTFQMTDATITASCSEMWDGLYGENGSTIITQGVSDSSEISHSRNGIHLAVPVGLVSVHYQISKTKFLNNYQHIQILNGFSAATDFIKYNRFYSNPDQMLKPYNKIDNFTRYYTQKAVSYFGDHRLAPFEGNKVTDCVYGVVGISDCCNSITVKNNTFGNNFNTAIYLLYSAFSAVGDNVINYPLIKPVTIQMPVNSPTIGVDVATYGAGPSFPPPNNRIYSNIFSGTNPTFLFSKNQYGVLAHFGQGGITIHSNSGIPNTFTRLKYGVYVFDIGSRFIWVFNNLFDRNQYAFYAGPNSAPNIQLNCNTFRRGTVYPTLTTYGIYIAAGGFLNKQGGPGFPPFLCSIIPGFSPAGNKFTFSKGAWKSINNNSFSLTYWRYANETMGPLVGPNIINTSSCTANSGTCPGNIGAPTPPLPERKEVMEMVDKLKQNTDTQDKQREMLALITRYFSEVGPVSEFETIANDMQARNLFAFNIMGWFFADYYADSADITKSLQWMQSMLNANPGDADMQNRAMYYNFLFKERHLTVPQDYELKQSDFDALLTVANSGTSSSLDAYLKLLYYSPETAARVNILPEINSGRDAETNADTLPPNLVPNPSFETYSTCPDNGDQIDRAVSWFKPTYSSPDYFNQCDATMFVGVPTNTVGYQLARTGVAYAGLIPYIKWGNTREYISALLLDSLQAGEKYYAEIWVSRADSQPCEVDGMGMYFSKGPPDTTGVGDFGRLPYPPQVSNPDSNILTSDTSWMKISGTFTAVGGENYITIGNFKDYTITDTSGNCSTSWSYYYIDDILVREDSVQGIEHTNLNKDNEGKLTNNIPNPFGDKAMVKYFVPLNAKRAELIVYDVIGRQRNTYKLTKGEGQVTVSADNLGNGIYFYSLVVDGKRVETKRMIILK